MKVGKQIFNRDCTFMLKVTWLRWLVRHWLVSGRHHHHHHLAIMEPGNLLTRSSVTHPEVSSIVSSVSFYVWAVVFSILGYLLTAFCFHVAFNSTCSPVLYPKLALYLIPLQSLYFFHNTSKYTSLFFSYTVFHLCFSCCSSGFSCLKGPIFSTV
jgi:hypothetical protein